MEHKIGECNKNFQMKHQEILEDKLVKIREETSKFRVILGPLIWKDIPFEGSYILEIHYIDSQKKHAKKLPNNGLNSTLFEDYASKAIELANQFSKERGFKINRHLNTWPQYQAVVSK